MEKVDRAIKSTKKPFSYNNFVLQQWNLQNLVSNQLL